MNIINSQSAIHRSTVIKKLIMYRRTTQRPEELFEQMADLIRVQYL